VWARRKGVSSRVDSGLDVDGGTAGIGCQLREAMARLGPGETLEVSTANEIRLDPVLDWCSKLGYLVLDRAGGSGGRLLIAKPGPRTVEQDTTHSPPHTWSVRGTSGDGSQVRVHAGRHTFTVGQAVSFRDDEASPGPIEYLLGALAADLCSGLGEAAAADGIEIDSLECRLSGQLDDALVSVGVVGAAGSAQLSTVTGTVYVSASGDEPALRRCWCRATERSPLFATLAQCVALRIDLRMEL
jgi:TusA-related sulfurtransferase